MSINIDYKWMLKGGYRLQYDAKQHIYTMRAGTPNISDRTREVLGGCWVLHTTHETPRRPGSTWYYDEAQA